MNDIYIKDDTLDSDGEVWLARKSSNVNENLPAGGWTTYLKDDTLDSDGEEEEAAR